MFDDSSPSCSRLRCEPKVLAQLFDHIHHRLVGEVSIGVSRSAFKVKTFHSDRGNRALTSLHDQPMALLASATSAKAQMTTEMCLDPRSEFDLFQYHHADPALEIIVCCKEVEDLLLPHSSSLSHSLSLSLSLCVCLSLSILTDQVAALAL
jgi:hypothetical protein